MNYLNKYWIFLIFLGIALMLGFLAYNLFTALSGANQEFVENVVPFDRNTLLSEQVETHFRE